MSKRAAYLNRGETYVVYTLDQDLREVSKTVASRNEIPEAVAAKCDRYEPWEFREVEITGGANV